MTEETALDLLSRLGLNLKTHTGVNSIDRYMKGGFEPGGFYEIVGEQAVGKTQFLYSLAASYLLVHKHKVAWIDMNGSFVSSRFIKFVTCCTEDILRRILISHAYRAHDLIRTLHEILDDFTEVKLVLIDNIGSILARSAFTIRDGEGKGQLASVFNALNKCAERGITVIATNHLIKSNGITRPALGLYWRMRYVTQRFFIGKDEISRFFRRVSEDEEFKSAASAVRFSIYEGGIREYDSLSL